MRPGDRVWAKLDHNPRNARQPWRSMFFVSNDGGGFVAVAFRAFGGKEYVAREQDVVSRELGDHLGPRS